MTNESPIGHVKLARKAFDPAFGDEFWLEHREFSRFEAWVDVIQLACYAPYKHQTGFGVIDLERGEFIASLRFLAARFKWSVKRVRHWLATCEKGARLRAQRETAAGTVYLIVNYDRYQSQGHSEGTAKGTAKGADGAQQGHKREAVKAIKAITTLPDSPKHRVMAYYRRRHPNRRPGEKELALIDRRLETYTEAELCEAIDGNAFDAWHIENGRQSLELIMRSNDKVDDYRQRYAAARPKSAIDPATGLPNEAGLAVIAGRR